VIVANARKVKLITQNLKKTDRMDAEQLARLARVRRFGTEGENHKPTWR
jgi:transposase